MSSRVWKAVVKTPSPRPPTSGNPPSNRHGEPSRVRRAVCEGRSSPGDEGSKSPSVHSSGTDTNPNQSGPKFRVGRERIDTGGVRSYSREFSGTLELDPDDDPVQTFRRSPARLVVCDGNITKGEWGFFPVNPVSGSRPHPPSGDGVRQFLPLYVYRSSFPLTAK